LVQLLDVIAQFNVILLSVMPSGFLVKMYGKGRGKITGSYQFATFYALFLAFIAQNIIVTLLANFIFLPFMTQILINNYPKVLTITAIVVLIFNMWFAWTFGYRQRLEIIALLIGAIIIFFLT
jgi:hypothetical protein